MAIPQSFWTHPNTTLSVSILVRFVWMTVLCLVAVWTASSLGGFSGTADENGSTKKLFNWHPLLMVLAVPVLMTEAVLSYRAPPMSVFPRSIRKLVHSILHFLSVICMTGAMVAVVASHRTATPKIDDLVFAHGWVGVTALCMFGLQFLLGGVMFAMAGVPESAKATFVDVHAFLGRAAYFLGLTTVVSGLVEKTAFLGGMEPEPEGLVMTLPKVTIVLMAILGLLVGYLHAFQEKEKNPEASPPEQEALIEQNA